MDERRLFVEVELSSVTSSRALQVLLARSLEFPEWYGCNWDAFWDAITGLVVMPRTLRLLGWTEFAARLPDDALQLRTSLEGMARDDPSGAAKVEYS